MSKKRNCRRTVEEAAVHKEAARLRRMDDRQLVEAFRKAQEAPATRPTEAESPAGEPEAEKRPSDVEKLLRGLSEGRCKGIKGATAYKVAMFASEMGLA